MKRIIAGMVGGLLMASAFPVYALENAGFVDGIWFSRSPVTDFGATQIFTIVHNESSGTLSGIATLFINDVAVGARDVSLAKGAIKKLEFSYEFSEGVSEVRTNFTSADGKDLTTGHIRATRVSVVADTDGDGIQNTTDDDDDGDGIPDARDAQPLVFNEAPKPEKELSEGGLAMLKRLTQRNSSEQEEVATSTPSDNAIIVAFQTIEDARKRGAVAVKEYEAKQRAELAEFEMEDDTASTTEEGGALSHSEEGKKREHQLAAAGAGWVGFVLDEEILFYIHILVLVLSVLHLGWSWFKKWFNKKEDEEGEDE